MSDEERADFEVLLESIQGGVKVIAEGHGALSSKIDHLVEGQSTLTDRIDRIELALGGVAGRIDRMETAFGARLASIEKRLGPNGRARKPPAKSRKKKR